MLPTDRMTSSQLPECKSPIQLSKAATTSHSRVVTQVAGAKRSHPFSDSNEAGPSKAFQDRQVKASQREVISKANLEREIGKGSFAAVYKCKTKDGEVIALKKPHERIYNRKIEFEAKILRELKGHPNVVRFLGEYQYEDLICLGMQRYLMNLYTALYLVAQGRDIFPDLAKVLMMMQGFFNGVEFVHGKQIIHADIAPKNVLLDKNGNLVLADFGSANSEKILGSCYYIAPELSPPLSERPNKKSDYFTVGFVFLQVLAKRNMFKAWDYKVNEEKAYKARDPRLNDEDNDALNLITQCIGVSDSAIEIICDKERLFQPDSPDLLSNETCEVKKENVKKLFNNIVFKMMDISPETRMDIKAALFMLSEFVRVEKDIGLQV